MTTEAPVAGYLHLQISGMRGVDCVPAVERCFKQLPGLQTVKVIYPPGSAWIGFADEVDLDDAIEALQHQGYTLKVVSQGEGPVPSFNSTLAFVKRLGSFLARLIGCH